MAPSIETSRDGRVLTARLANPPLQFMNAEMVEQLNELLASLEGDDSIGAVIVTGAAEGRFITHYDVGDIVASVEEVGVSTGPGAAGALLRTAGGISRIPGGAAALRRTPARPLAELRALHEAFVRMNRLDKVVIAAINGVATGGGCELALACDIRYMAEGDGHIGLPEMSVGFNPGGGGTQRLSRAIGAGRALEMMLEARTLTPEEALEVGLVHRVVPAERLLQESAETATRMARRSPISIKALKHAVYEGATRPLDEGLAIERKWFMAAAGTDASRRAMHAYADQVERDGEAPWFSRDGIRPWQDGTATDLVDDGD